MKNKLQKIETGIIAEGEATGHCHRAVGDGVEVYDGPKGREIHATDDGVTVTHEEHQAIHMPPGVYECGIVREYDHLKEEAKRVID